MRVVDEDRRRFERLFHEHYDAVLAYAVVRADLPMAKDAVAQTFLVAWRRREELPERPLPWLLGVTRKTLAEQRRAASRRDSLTERLQAFGARDDARSSDPAEQVADADGVVSAFLTLGERDREILRLVAWERLGPADAARVLGCSRATFAVRLSRARRRLSAALAAHDAADSPGPIEIFPEPVEAP
jgi:RNA polymerase sigma-70 factor (ECF subfamily)